MKEDSDQVGQYTRISQLLRKAGHKPDDANEITELISNMASANIVSRFESKLDTSNTRLESKIDIQNSRIDAQNSKYNVLIWVIGAGVVILSTVITIVGLAG